MSSTHTSHTSTVHKHTVSPIPLCSISLTAPFPLQRTTASIAPGNLRSGSASGHLGPGFPGCAGLAGFLSAGTSVSDASARVGGTGHTLLSLSTFILTQLPAFRRAQTASWWVISCMFKPLTWTRSEVRGHTATALFICGGCSQPERLSGLMI